MTQHPNNSKNILVLTPVFGIVVFVVLYVVATFLYPGGSHINNNSVGFSWANNYWCNLLSKNAINGQYNPAKSVALTAMFILCFTLSLFWYLFPIHVNLSSKLKFTTRLSGALSMSVAFFLFTSFNHDFIINLASVFGLAATAGVFVGLYKKKWFGLFAFGFFNILLIGLNNYVYHTNGLIVYLPAVQKITFASFLCWVCCINIHLYLKQGKTAPTNISF